MAASRFALQNMGSTDKVLVFPIAPETISDKRGSTLAGGSDDPEGTAGGVTRTQVKNYGHRVISFSANFDSFVSRAVGGRVVGFENGGDAAGFREDPLSSPFRVHDQIHQLRQWQAPMNGDMNLQPARLYLIGYEPTPFPCFISSTDITITRYDGRKREVTAAAVGVRLVQLIDSSLDRDSVWAGLSGGDKHYGTEFRNGNPYVKEEEVRELTELTPQEQVLAEQAAAVNTLQAQGVEFPGQPGE